MLNQSYLPGVIKKFLLLISFLTLVLVLQSSGFKKEKKYPVSEIPKELLVNSKAVIRKYETTFRIKSPGSAEMNITYALTILNDNGIENSEFFETYGDFNKLRFKSAVIYSADGEVEERFSAGDLVESGTASGSNLFDKVKMAYLDPDYRKVPFTIEYNYDIIFKGLLQFPKWSPYDDFNVSVENSSLRVVTPADYRFRFLERNNIPGVRVSQNDEENEFLWEVKNLPSIKPEIDSPSLPDIIPIVYTGPSDFIIDDYPGNSDTWENFGKWIYSLNKDLHKLPDETVAMVKEMTSGAGSIEEKAKILYKYFQSKTRYVSVQIGIGGWQPFSATEVDNTSYGDCKALSNYMVSLLEAAGIKSYYTLIRAGDEADRMLPEFSSNQFNHAIVCIPNNTDTIWLECTSQEIPFNYLGSFTDDRDALLIDEEGGKLTHTRIYGPDDNIKINRADIFINTSGDGKANVVTSYTGKYYSDISYLLRMDEIDRRKRVINNIHIPNFSLADYNFNEKKDKYPEISETLKLNLPAYISSVGSRAFLKMNLMESIETIPFSMEKRKYPIEIRRSETTIDTLVYHLPQGMSVTGEPDRVNLDSKFGSYTCEVFPGDSLVTYTRKLIMNKGVYQAASFDEYLKFNEDIRKADSRKLLIDKN